MDSKELDECWASLPPQKKRALFQPRPSTTFKPADFVPPVRLFRNGVQCNQLLEREALINKICLAWKFGAKTRVVSLIASKGMGKTTLLEFLADPSRVPQLKPPQLLRSGKCGRILCVHAPDFEKFDPDYLWQSVISQHCATIFDGCTVGGIEFSAVGVISAPDTSFTLSVSMRTWLAYLHDKPVDDAFEELKRLTSLAFGEEQDGEVIALVDECQSWANTLMPHGKNFLYHAVSTVPKWVRIGITGLTHNQLNVLSDDGVYYVCTEGELTTLSRSAAFEVVGESPIASIVVALTRVPRILRFVGEVQEQFPEVAPLDLLEHWRHKVSMYNQTDLSTFTLEEASWLIAATTCRWIVPHFVQGTHEVCVPGTTLPWQLLQARSFITRNVDGQVSLIFGTIQNCSSDWMEHLKAKFYKLFGVTLDHAVFSYAQWIESKMKNATTLIADNWEHLVNAALVLRYHLLSKQIETKTGTRPVGLPLSKVYECDEKLILGMCCQTLTFVWKRLFMGNMKSLFPLLLLQGFTPTRN